MLREVTLALRDATRQTIDVFQWCLAEGDAVLALPVEPALHCPRGGTEWGNGFSYRFFVIIGALRPYGAHDH